jgi:branched-chain amino acid transport system ATP-binding protein
VLEVESLNAWYGPVQAVRAVTFDVDAGERVAIIGANGAGKTTLLRSLMGLHSSRQGTIRVDGVDVSSANAVRAARSGLALVPQGRRLFGSLTVDEHLKLASRQSRSSAVTVDDIMEFFPRLAERLRLRAASLSGGEQQMLAIARAVLQGPRYVMFDEPTEGLAPIMVAAVDRLISELPRRRLGVVLVEQDENPLVAKADRLFTMSRGELATGEGGCPQGPHASCPSSLVNQGDLP